MRGEVLNPAIQGLGETNAAVRIRGRVESQNCLVQFFIAHPAVVPGDFFC